MAGNSEHSSIINVPSKTSSGNVIKVNGLNIHYEQIGNGSIVLLLLPGALGTSRTDFEHQLDQFDKRQFTLIAWDPPGYGFSRPPNRTFPENFHRRDARIAIQLMEKLNYRSYSLLGWSDGGITALIIAATKQHTIQKLIVVAAKAYLTETDIKIAEALRNIDDWSENMRKRMLNVYDENYFRKTWSEWVDSLQRIYFKLGGDICKCDMCKIQCPTLVVQGLKDPAVPQEHAKYLHENIKDSTLVNFPDGRHNVHQKFWKPFNEMVKKFLLQNCVCHL